METKRRILRFVVSPRSLMETKRRILRFVGESTLWTVANALCIGLPTLLVYILGTQFEMWSPWKLSIYMVMTLVLTSTWGSWATLVWTRSRVLRSMQQGITTLPGITVMALGGALLYLGFGKLYLALAVLAGGVGMIVTAVALAGGFFSKNSAPNKLQYPLGLFLYPLATTLTSGLVASLWYMFASNPSSAAKWPAIISIAGLMTTLLASSLISTVIPAVMSRVCHELSGKLSAERGRW
jgi:hypothetical protein